MDEVLHRLDVVLGHLETLLHLQTSAPESDWVDSQEFCRLVGLKDSRALNYQMSKGIFDTNAIRNIGTAKRPRYRYHRVKAVNQFLYRKLTNTYS